MAKATELIVTEEKVRRDTREVEMDILSVMLELLDRFLAGFGAIAQSGSFTKTETNLRHQVWLHLSSRAFNSLRWTFYFLESGYYQQAAILVRSSWEDWLCCEDSKNHEETVEALLEGKGEIRVPNFRTMADRLPEDLEEEWNGRTVDGEPLLGVYGMLSTLSHPRRFAIATTVTDTHELRVGPAYDEDMFLWLSIYTIRGMVKMLDILNILVNPLDQNWTTETTAIIKQAADCKSRIDDRLVTSLRQPGVA